MSMVKISRMTKILNNTLYLGLLDISGWEVYKKSEGNSYQHENTAKQ